MIENWVKVRDDHAPLKFARSEAPENELKFQLFKDHRANWCPDNTFSITDLRSRVEPWLTSLVPDNLRGLLRELPSLPSRNAILLGWASELPVFVQMNYLKKEHRPKSDDPDYWNVWTGKKERNVDWGKVAFDWQNPLDEIPNELSLEKENVEKEK